MKKAALIYYTILFFIALQAFVAVVANGQTRKLKPNEIVDIGNGQTFKVLRSRGEGLKTECEVIYYVNKKKIGNPFWLPASRILEQEKALQAKVQKESPAAKPEVTKQPVSVTKPVTPKTAAPNKKTKKDLPAVSKTAKGKDTAKTKEFAAALKIVTTPQQKKVGNTEKTAPPDEIILQTPKIPGVAPRNITPNNTELQSRIASPEEVNKVLDAKKLGVFIDCRANCDMNYIRTDITVVDFLLDRIAADVHVLISEQATGGGGSSIQIIFYGQHTFIGIKDTTIINIDRNATSFERREEMVKGMKVGLIRFLSQNPYMKFLDIKMKVPEKEDGEPVNTKDNWNYWVFGIGTEGTISSDQVYKSTNASGYVNVNRTTDKLKVHFSVNGNYNRYIYNYENNGTVLEYLVKNSDYFFQHSLVKSIKQHWGVGYQAVYSNNTFTNNKSRLYGRAAFEYSIFPYKDVNTRFFTLSYGVDVRNNTYYDTTIYFKTQETLFGQTAEANISIYQKWGSFSSRIRYSSFLTDPSFNNLSAYINFSIRITGGLSFYMYADASRVRDQIYLVKGKASEQDVLTRRRQLASEYNFYSGGGLSFRFGSRLNNFVNPRMGGL